MQIRRGSYTSLSPLRNEFFNTINTRVSLIDKGVTNFGPKVMINNFTHMKKS
jgi:hypothetical protein